MKQNNFLLSSLIYSLVFCIFSSCINDNQKGTPIPIIKVDLGNKQAENSITIKSVIPLQTSDSCLIGYTTKVIVWNNRIIVLDDYRSKAMFIFNEKGKLVLKTAIGKGPGEISTANAININKKDSTILLYDQTQKVFHQFDFNGHYIARKSLPSDIFLYDFFQLSNDSFLVYYPLDFTNSKGEIKRSTYRIYSNDFLIVKPLDIFIAQNKLIPCLVNPVARFSDEILFVSPWNYNIYELEGDTFRVKYSLDFGDAALTPSQMEILTPGELISLVHLNKNNKVGSLQSVYFNDKDLLIFAEYADIGLNILFSLKDKIAYNLNNYFEKGLLPKCRVWGISDNGSIYAVVEPEDFVDFNKLMSGRYNYLRITSNDNPILISFQIKGSL
jgi:hypothetical protein